MIGPASHDLSFALPDSNARYFAPWEILNFYSNYHSSRFVGDELVLRVRVAPDGEQLEELNGRFSDILTRGAIRVSGALAGEGQEATPHEIFPLQISEDARDAEDRED